MLQTEIPTYRFWLQRHLSKNGFTSLCPCPQSGATTPGRTINAWAKSARFRLVPNG